MVQGPFASAEARLPQLRQRFLSCINAPINSVLVLSQRKLSARRHRLDFACATPGVRRLCAAPSGIGSARGEGPRPHLRPKRHCHRGFTTSLLSQRPAHSAHRPSRARPRGRARRLPAVVRVRNGRPDLPAGCQRAACRRSAACCWSSVSLPAAGHICSHAVAATRAATSLQCMGGDRGCSGVPGLLGVALGGCRNVVGCQI